LRSTFRTPRGANAEDQPLPRDHDQDVWDEVHHSLPHFHAYYAEYEASFDLAGNIIVGELPRRQLRLVQAWAEICGPNHIAA
jgi:hypothetical protein